MKRISFLFLAISTFCLSLGACNNNPINPSNPSSSNPSSESETTKELTNLSATYNRDITRGEMLKIDSLSVIATYSDRSKEEVKNKCEYYLVSARIDINSYSFNDIGTFNITAKYENLSADFAVTVNPRPNPLQEIFFETKQVFDYAGEYQLILAYQFNDREERVEMIHVQHGLYRYKTTFSIEGDISFTAYNDYYTVKNQIFLTIPEEGNMFVLDTLTTGHWTTYTSNYEPVMAKELIASYQDAEVEQNSKLDYDKLTVSVYCNDQTTIIVNDYKLYYLDRMTKRYINSDFTFDYHFNVGDSVRIYAEGYGYETSFTIRIAEQTIEETIYLNALCGFDCSELQPHKEGFGIFAFVGEEGSEQMFRMERVGNFEHVYSAKVNFKAGHAFYVSFKVAMMYSTIAHSYLFNGPKTEKMYMSSEYNMFGVAELRDDLMAYGSLHSFDENFDYDNDIIYNVAYDGWLTSLRGNLTYRQRIYDKRTQILDCDEIYYQNGEDERRINRLDGDGNVIDNYYIRNLYGRRYMYFEEGGIRRIEDTESESWWWSGSDKVRYTVNPNGHYTDGAYDITYSQHEILNYIDDPEHFFAGNVWDGYQESFFKFENYQLKELWFINGNNVFQFTDFSDWGKTEPEPLNISFKFYIRTNWLNVSYTIYNQNDEEVGSGYTDKIDQYVNYQMNISQVYDELDVFGEENQYYYVVFSTTDDGFRQSKTSGRYMLHNALWNGQTDRTKDYTLDNVFISISDDGVVTDCDLPIYF